MIFDVEVDRIFFKERQSDWDRSHRWEDQKDFFKDFSCYEKA